MKHYVKKERLLSVEGMSLSYGPKLILRDINLVVDDIVRENMTQGQVVALLGPSGIGKTQLFRCLAGLIRPSKGVVKINGSHIVQAGSMGVVQQAYPLMQHRTILGNLLLAKNDKEAAHKILTQFGLSDKADKYPVQLSGGQRQRVAIMQQLLCSNHFLLMDEPFSGLDIIAKSLVCNVISQVSTAHELNTIIVTTHDVESAIQIADTVWIMGREKDKPGATVVRQIDLIDRDLAWNPEVEKHPNYWPTVREIKDLFITL